MTDLPVRDGDDALRVNWLEITSARPDGTVTYCGAFVTSLPVDHGNVAELADCARARRKIENETFNVLKQHGYHLEHNLGHGRDTLAAVLVALNLLAFALRTDTDPSNRIRGLCRQWRLPGVARAAKLRDRVDFHVAIRHGGHHGECRIALPVPIPTRPNGYHRPGHRCGSNTGRKRSKPLRGQPTSRRCGRNANPVSRSDSRSPVDGSRPHKLRHVVARKALVRYSRQAWDSHWQPQRPIPWNCLSSNP